MSGRFDFPHAGHIRTIQLLASDYDSVVVAILDYPEQKWPLCYRRRIFEEIFWDYKNVKVLSNKTHFGEMTLAEWKTYKCDYYAAGNFEVLNHMESIGVPCIYVDRPYQISARYYDKPKET